MTIRELIEELKKYDQDMSVCYPYIEDKGISGYITVNKIGYEYGGKNGDDIVGIMLL